MRRVLIICVALAAGIALTLAQPADEDIVHVVSAGDTLISIAHDYGVTLDQLLTLNDLHPEALLQIGQRLLVMRAPEFAGDGGDGSEHDDSAAADERALDDSPGREDLPPAPVTQADAPMRDPADISPQLCFIVYVDENQNGMLDRGEDQLPNATIRLLDVEDVERLRYTSDSAPEPICPRELERKLYMIEGDAPPGYGWTSAARLRIDLREGGLVRVNFGAKAGLDTTPIRPAAPAAAEDEGLDESPRSLLREFSGIFALGLAFAVFGIGAAVSLFVWGRG